MKKIISYSYLKNTINKQTNKKYILKATCNGHTKKILDSYAHFGHSLNQHEVHPRMVFKLYKKVPVYSGLSNSHSLEAKFTCLIISKIKSKTKVWMESTAHFIISYIINTAM